MVHLNDLRHIDISGSTASLISRCTPIYTSYTPEGISLDMQTGVLFGWGWSYSSVVEMNPACNNVGSWSFYDSSNHNGGDLENINSTPTPLPTATMSPTPTASATPSPSPTPPPVPSAGGMGLALLLGAFALLLRRKP
jgi:MYXO-CTERM domain-containing protein